MTTKRCEDCVLRLRPKYGLPSDGVSRWCALCATSHEGAERVAKKRAGCEGCNLKQPTFGLRAIMIPPASSYLERLIPLITVESSDTPVTPPRTSVASCPR